MQKINLVVNAVQSASNKTNDGVQAGKKAGMSLLEIVKSVETVDAIVQEISKLMQEQLATTKRISDSMDMVNKITNDTSQGTENITNEVRHQSENFENISILAKELNLKSLELKDLSEKFII